MLKVLSIILVTLGIMVMVPQPTPSVQETAAYAMPEVTEPQIAPGPVIKEKNPGIMKKLPVLILKKENTLIFDQVVTDESVAKFQDQLFNMSARLPRNATIYMVLYTPGGSVMAGSQLIESVKSIPQEVKTLTVFAASMGFQFAQAMGERLILPSGTLMSHRASLSGLSGELGGELEVRLDWIKRQVEFMERRSAARMKMSLKEYQDLIRDEYWVFGFESKKKKVADTVTLARCDKSMLGTHWEEMKIFFFTVKVKLSDCPLITAPLAVDLSGIQDPMLMKQAGDFMGMYYSDPARFYHEYVKTSKYKEFLE